MARHMGRSDSSSVKGIPEVVGHGEAGYVLAQPEAAALTWKGVFFCIGSPGLPHSSGRGAAALIWQPGCRPIWQPGCRTHLQGLAFFLKKPTG